MIIKSIFVWKNFNEILSPALEIYNDCELTFGNPQPDNPIFYRNVSQMDCTQFKELINNKVSSLPVNFGTATELDRIANDLPNVVKEAFEASCPLRKKKTQTRPVSKEILAHIKRKRKLRREKSAAMQKGDLLTAQNIQKESNLVGNQIKKQQKLEQRVRSPALKLWPGTIY